MVSHAGRSRADRSSLARASLSGIGCVFVAIATLTGCGGDECGIHGAPATGIVAATTPTALEYGNLVAGLNNDCPASDAPAGIISLTITGRQVSGAGFFTLCVERPDRLGELLALGIDVKGSPVHVIDVTGSADNCTYRFDETTPPQGTATGDGVCGDGANPAGFALVVAGSISLDRTCGGVVDQVAVTLSGRVAATPP